MTVEELISHLSSFPPTLVVEGYAPGIEEFRELGTSDFRRYDATRLWIDP